MKYTRTAHGHEIEITQGLSCWFVWIDGRLDLVPPTKTKRAAITNALGYARRHPKLVPGNAYVTVEHYDTSLDGRRGSFTVTTAIFWAQQAAHDFARAENDAVQAELVTVETIPLVDRYGVPCRLADLPLIAPWTLDKPE